MGTIWDAVGRFFGPSKSNTQFAEQIDSLAKVAVECAAHFRTTAGRDLKSIVDFERKADRIVDDIHELLDNSFILRFDVQDAMELTDEVDNLVDGLRKIAIHLDIYKDLIRDLDGDAAQLVALGEQGIIKVAGMTAMIGEPRLDLAKARELADAVSKIESDADQLVAAVERRLVRQYSPAGANRLEFLAWTKLFELLEKVTDDAKHCAKLILSLARKES